MAEVDTGGFPRASVKAPFQPHPAQTGGQPVSLNWERVAGITSESWRGPWVGLTLPASLFSTCSGKYITSWGRICEVGEA